MNVLITIPLEKKHMEMLESMAPDADFVYATASEADEAMIAEADVILGNVEPELINASDRLKWLQLNNAGADAYTKPGILSPETILTNASGAYGLNISEHMLGMLLMLIKKFDRYYLAQRSKDWTDFGTVRSIWGSRVLILGLGDIGGQFAKKVHALGAYTIGIKRHIGNKPDYLDELTDMEHLDEQLALADFIACSLPASDDTYHLFNSDRFSIMKNDSILINIGRGSLIDSLALCEALKNGSIGGACLDVTEPEPLPQDHPLWDAPNLILTPHVSGHYHLPETLERIRHIAIENFKAYVNGEPLKNKVDRKTGYRINTSDNKLI